MINRSLGVLVTTASRWGSQTVAQFRCVDSLLPLLLRNDLWIHLNRLALDVRTQLQGKMHKKSWCHARIWDGWGVRTKASQGYQAVMSSDTKAETFRARFVAQSDVLLFQIWVCSFVMTFRFPRTDAHKLLGCIQQFATGSGVFNWPWNSKRVQGQMQCGVQRSSQSVFWVTVES